MANVCKICTHPQRLEIDRALVSGQSKATIARTFGVSECSLSNHAANHLSRQLVTAYEARSANENLDLMNRIDKMINNAETIFQRNFDEKKDYLALQALNSQKGIIELLAKISAYLHQSRVMELEARKNEENQAINERIKKLPTCELNLLGDIQSKLAGELPLEKRLLPKEFYADEADNLSITLTVPKSKLPEGAEDKIINVRTDGDGGTTTFTPSKVVDGFVNVIG